MWAIYVLTIFVGILWVIYRRTNRAQRIAKLVNATKLDVQSVDRLFAIRAVDDEASLSLALGAIWNRATAVSLAHAALSACIQSKVRAAWC